MTTTTPWLIIEHRKPTAMQIIYDALKAEHLTAREISSKTGIGYSQVRRALAALKGNIECTKGPRYSLLPMAQRPKDRRGRKPLSG